MPWGRQAPLKTFMPSGKLLARDYLYDLAVAMPDFSDEGLRAEMERAHGLKLSRRSIAQYRKELRLEGRGLRKAAAKAPAESHALGAGTGAMACAAGA